MRRGTIRSRRIAVAVGQIHRTVVAYDRGDRRRAGLVGCEHGEVGSRRPAEQRESGDIGVVLATVRTNPPERRADILDLGRPLPPRPFYVCCWGTRRQACSPETDTPPLANLSELQWYYLTTEVL